MLPSAVVGPGVRMRRPYFRKQCWLIMCGFINGPNRERRSMTSGLIRRLLTIVFIAFVLAVTVNRDMAQSARPTIMIVHGAWGGAWAFRKVDAELREKGYNVYRPELTGLGERVHLSRPDIGLSTHIDDVVNAILFEDLHDIILVGHSY